MQRGVLQGVSRKPIGNMSLTFSILGKIFSRRHIEISFSYFSQNTGFDSLCKLSAIGTICMKSHILFSGKNKKNIYQFVAC